MVIKSILHDLKHQNIEFFRCFEPGYFFYAFQVIAFVWQKVKSHFFNFPVLYTCFSITLYGVEKIDFSQNKCSCLKCTEKKYPKVQEQRTNLIF